MANLIIIGSGPAGLTAAIYAVRGGLKTTIVEGVIPGGQLMLTTEVENYPGFPEPTRGSDIMALMRKQTERLGVEFIPGDATHVDFTTSPFKVTVNKKAYEADAVIVATGASAKWLGFESEKRLRGKGVSSCATCDGFFFKNKDVVVVGGGDTAVEEALFLSKLVRNVTIIHRRDQLRAVKTIQEKAFRKENIKFLWNTIVEEIQGERKVEGVRVKDLQTGITKVYPCDAVFVSIGYTPNTGIFKEQLELDEVGYIKTKNRTATSRAGVFTAGDVSDRVYHQAITAAASGCQAAIEVIKYLESAECSS